MAAERKLLFFLAWANEQPPQVYDMLALEAAAEHEKHAAALGSQKGTAAATAGAASGLDAHLAAALNGSGSSGGGDAQAQQQAQRGAQVAGAQQAQRSSVLIEEL